MVAIFIGLEKDELMLMLLEVLITIRWLDLNIFSSKLDHTTQLAQLKKILFHSENSLAVY